MGDGISLVPSSVYRREQWRIVSLLHLSITSLADLDRFQLLAHFLWNVFPGDIADILEFTYKADGLHDMLL